MNYSRAHRLYQEINAHGVRQRHTVTDGQHVVTLGFWQMTSGWVTIVTGTGSAFEPAFIDAMRQYKRLADDYATSSEGKALLKAHGW